MKAGWEIKRIGDVAEIIMGQSPDGQSYNTEGIGIPLINGPVEFSSNSFGKTIRSKFTTQPTKLCKENDLILCVRGSTTGRINIAGFDACIGRGVAAIRARANQDWINYFIRFKRNEIYNIGTGATFPNVSGNSLSSLELAFPPLPEQRRIVAILDEAFADIAAAKEKAAQNLKNAKEVFASYLESIFADAWLSAKIVKLEDLATDITDGDHMPPPKTKEGVPFITIGNIIKETREIDFSETFMVSNEYFNGLKYSKRPVAGDILYTVTGSFGIPVLIRESKKFCFQRHIGLIRPKEKVYSEWLCYLLMSPQVVKQANEGATGTAQRTVSLSVLRNFQVPSLSLSKQKDIAGKVSDIGKETSRLESIYQQKLSNLQELKKSLLQQAFSGAL